LLIHVIIASVVNCHITTPRQYTKQLFTIISQFSSVLVNAHKRRTQQYEPRVFCTDSHSKVIIS